MAGESARQRVEGRLLFWRSTVIDSRAGWVVVEFVRRAALTFDGLVQQPLVSVGASVSNGASVRVRGFGGCVVWAGKAVMA
jgi:hypothetical protein